MERIEVSFHLPEPYHRMRLASRDAGWQLAEHDHPIFQIIWVTEGVLELRNHHAVHRLRLGHLCIIPPRQPHSLSTKRGYQQLGIDLTLQDSRGFVALLERRLRVLTVLDRAHLLSALPELKAAYRRLDVDSRLRTAHILDSILLDSVAQFQGERAFQQELILLLSGRMSEKLLLDEVARHMGLSKTHLERLTHREFGCSVMELSARLRTNEACSLLINSELSLTQIAEALGFYDPPHFSRFFKKRMSATPMEFRRANR